MNSSHEPNSLQPGSLLSSHIKTLFESFQCLFVFKLYISVLVCLNQTSIDTVRRCLLQCHKYRSYNEMSLLLYCFIFRSVFLGDFRGIVRGRW